MNRALAALLLTLLLAPMAAAELNVSLPLGPYYRPGRFIPVQISADLADVPGARVPGSGYTARSSPASAAPEAGGDTRAPINLTLVAEGTVAVSLPVDGGQCNAVVPWFVRQRPANPRAAVGGFRYSVSLPLLGPLGDDQCLAVIAGDQMAAEALLAELFPSQAPMPSTREPADPLPGPAAAWDMLDAVVLDEAPARAVGMDKLADLVPGGTVVAVRSNRPLDSRWPWETHGAYQILRREVAGPKHPLYGSSDQAIYDAVAGWNAAWPAPFRQRLFLCGAAVALGLAGISLWRSRWASVLGLCASLAAVGGLAYWWKFQTPVLQQTGQVLVIDKLTQQDTWIYQTSSQKAYAQTNWLTGLRPIFASAQSAAATRMRLHCHENGQPECYVYEVGARQQLVFLARTIGPQAPSIAAKPPDPTPLLDLARKLYMRSGDTIGQINPTPISRPSYQPTEAWPTLIVKRK